ncbi:MAG TPA: F0F1 ATP synthase subunit A [Bryobacteraceae bacterium]|jgi:F-type H+-transporting ATPase subunit a|nr:F0F1 ATP synthase subunit A [Bryobacteraceae bacterium]
MDQTEIFLTKIFNDHLAGTGNSILSLVGLSAAPRPWTNFICMELLVVLIVVVVFAVLRTGLSVVSPGKFQQVFELIYEFIDGQANDMVGHAGHRYIAFFGMLFIFVLFANLIGIIPGLESPTMYPYVPAGLAVAAFLYYNAVGIQVKGFWQHLKHFAGPVWWLAPLMVVIEVVGNLARPLSLTLRLYANMYAGEAVTGVFLSLTYLVIPALFMALHVFVALLQAYIFMALTMVYVAGAVAHEEH